MMKLGYRSGKLGKELTTFLEFMTAPASKILDKWFESDVLKATLATDAIIGAKVRCQQRFACQLCGLLNGCVRPPLACVCVALYQVSPSTPGSAYILFHHVMGEVNGVKGMWGHVKGGMGGVSQALERSAMEAGAEIFTSSPVKSIDVHNGRVRGVSLESGGALEADVVLSNASPLVTMLDLLDESVLPERVVTHFKKNWNCESASTKVRDSVSLESVCVCVDMSDRRPLVLPQINVALDRLPNFSCIPNTGDGNTPMRHHRGTTHFEDSMEQVRGSSIAPVLGWFVRSSRAWALCSHPRIARRSKTRSWTCSTGTRPDAR